MKRLVLALGVVLLSFPIWAATPYKKTLNVKSNLYMKDGVYIGARQVRALRFWRYAGLFLQRRI